MAIKRSVTSSLAAVLILNIGGYAQATEFDSRAVRDKLESPELNYAAVHNGGPNASFGLAAARTPTLRDSGRSEAMLFATNANFRFIGEIGFYIQNLVASLHPFDPGAPVVFDDPESFAIHVHKGSIVASPAQLEALLNEHVFALPDAVVRKIKVYAAPGELTLVGELKRSRWIPFVLKGSFTVRDGHELVYQPKTVVVDGVDATRVLPAANVELIELLPLSGRGTTLEGSRIVLNVHDGLFPPPVLQLNIVRADVDDRGLVLEFDDGRSVPAAAPMAATKSHLLVYGGDVQFMRTMPLNVSLQVDSDSPDRALDFCLYDYGDQLAKGSLTLAPGGEIRAFFPQPDCAY